MEQEEKTEGVSPLAQEAEHKAVIRKLFSERKQYEDATKEKRQECIDIYNAFIGKMEDSSATPYNSQENIPRMRTEIAYIVPYIFSGEPEFEVAGIGDEDTFGAKILEKILNFRLNSIPNAYDTIEMWVKQSVGFGTSFLHVFWKTVIGKDQAIKEDRPELQTRNYLDVFYDPTIANIEDQKSIIVRMQMTEDQIKSNSAFNENKDKVEETDKQTITGNYDSSKLDQTDFASRDKGCLIDVYERYTRDRIQTVVDGKEQLLVRDVEVTRDTFDFVKLIFELNIIPNRTDGYGVGQNTIAINKLQHKLDNQTLMNVKLINNPMFFTRRGAKIDKRQLVAKPAGAIEVDDVDKDIKQIQFNDLKQGVMRFRDEINQERQKASGANELIQGGASNDTLGQDQLAQTNSSNRFEIIQRRFRKALSLVGQKLIELEIENIQDINSPILRIFPEEMRQGVFEFLTKSARDLKYDVKIRGNTTVSKNKDLESKRMVDLFNLASAPNSPVMLSTTEARAFIRRIAERQGEQNIDEIIAKEAPQPPMMGMDGMPMGMPPEGMPQDGSGLVPGMMSQPGEIATQEGLNQQVQ